MMKLLSVLILQVSIIPIYSQTKKFSFQLRKYDSIEFHPYKFSGTFNRGVLSFSVQYEKDFSTNKNVIESIPTFSTSVETNIKPNGQRDAKFRFEFFDEQSNLLLDTSTAFNIELFDGYAIPPNSDIMRFKYKLPVEPCKVTFIWSFFDENNIKNKIEKVYFIELNKYSEDYSMEIH